LKDVGLCILSLPVKFIAYCKLFSKKTTRALSASGFNNWCNRHTRFCKHENPKNHLEATWSFYDYLRFYSGQTNGKEQDKIVKAQMIFQ